MDWAIVGPMTMDPAEQKEALEAARRAGIDLSLIEANLALSVRDRWQQHDAALLLSAEKAGKRQDQPEDHDGAGIAAEVALEVRAGFGLAGFAERFCFEVVLLAPGNRAAVLAGDSPQDDPEDEQRHASGEENIPAHGIREPA
jgi:hypothetical protein